MANFLKKAFDDMKESAKAVLAGKFADVRIIGEYIHIYDESDTAAIVDYLMKNGHIISEIRNNKIGLEEYYIELMSERQVI